MTAALLFKHAHRTATVWALRLHRAGALVRHLGVPLSVGMRMHKRAERTSRNFTRRMADLEALTTKGGANNGTR